MLDSPISHLLLRGLHPTPSSLQLPLSSSCRSAAAAAAAAASPRGFTGGRRRRSAPMPEASSSLSMESRVGRANQRYSAAGERLVAGVVALSDDKYYVLLVQSNSGRGWVLPKGGWETDEATAEEAACREAWEEAGAKCTIIYDLGDVADLRKHTGKDKDKEGNSKVKALYRWFEATVDTLEATWPEMNKRNRMWMTFVQAEAALADRPELLEALRRSTMIRA